jgi:hypothetical protein
VSHLVYYRISLEPPKVPISAAWAQCSISQYGSTREAQLTSPRKKIKEHKESTAHSLTVKIAKEAESKTLEKVVDSMTKSEVDSIVKVMRTAYYITKMTGHALIILIWLNCRHEMEWKWELVYVPVSVQ